MNELNLLILLALQLRLGLLRDNRINISATIRKYVS